MKDKSCSRSLEKFTRTLKDSLQKLTAGDDGVDNSTAFDSPAVDAETRIDDTQQVTLPVRCTCRVMAGPVCL